MLRDRYQPTDLFALVPQLGLRFEPQLAQLDRLLDDDELFRLVREDMARRRPSTRTRGRPSTPVEVVLRLLVVMRLYGWSYERAEYFVNDSLVLRQFCRLGLEKVPDDTTLIRWANLIGPETLQRLNDRVVQLAQGLKVTRGRKLRVDTTAVETNIHYPTDSGLLGDGVRAVSRLLRRAKAALGGAAELGRQAFRSRVRTVRRVAQQLHRLGRRKGAEAAEGMKGAYGLLIDTAKKTAAQASRVAGALAQAAGEKARRVAAGLAEFLPRLRQGIQQAYRRVIAGESVPAREKLLSLFEPHTQIIPRHKAGKQVEFGRKVRLDEVEGGIVSGYRVLERGGGQDQPYLADSLDEHVGRFGRAPEVLAVDRGLSSRKNEKKARQMGVKRLAMPGVGRAPPGGRAVERERWFRRAYRFRAGAEGRIHALRRDYGLRRCLYRGEAGMGRWVGWGIVAHNLAKIARTVAFR